MSETRLLPMAQEKIICWLSGGAEIKRDAAPPYRWWRQDAANMFHVVGKASVSALVRAGKVRIEEVIGERYVSHRLVLSEHSHD